MIRLISSCLFMGFVFIGFGNTLHVTDESSGKPLNHVAVTCTAKHFFTSTNSAGEADITILTDSDSITLELVGYQQIKTSVKALKVINFIVPMRRLDALLSEVVVSAYKEDTTKYTSLHIETLGRKTIDKSGAFSLTDALTNLSGVSQLSTGIGISKPVVRGLYGNRILVLFSGLRFDNQQWQDEHGLGLSTIGIGGVELIKGPMSILYGTEAIGGVINVMEEQASMPGTTEFDVQMLIHSNTGGGTVQLGKKVNYGAKFYSFRAGLTRQSDYSDGNNNRVLNSRFNGLYAKASFGLKKKKWQSDNHYHFSYNQFGFVFDNSSHFTMEDHRWSKKMSGPHHIVMLNMLSSLNRFQFKNSLLTVNAGIQSNMRSENEGGGELSLIMHLLSMQYAAKWKKQLNKKWLIVGSNNAILERNSNYGKRKIVPNAQTLENGLSIYLKKQNKSIVLEYGVGVGVKHISTYSTQTVNTPEKDILPFRQQRLFYNGMIGLSFNPSQAWNFKANVSSGVRAPNLAELSANGLHEGIYTYEIGDPNMKNEQNVNGDINLTFHKSFLQFSVGGFYNHFNNFIYLNPTDDEWFGFPIYRFTQYNAHLVGDEITLTIQPPKVRRLKISAQFSSLVGKLSTGDYLPYMPANKLAPKIRYQTSSNNKWVAFCFIGSTIVMQQNLLNPQETYTPSYQLFTSGFGVTRKVKKVEYVLNVTGNNLFNSVYFDHLSRYKNFGLLNPGRNISIHLKIKTSNTLKNTKNENIN